MGFHKTVVYQQHLSQQAPRNLTFNQIGLHVFCLPYLIHWLCKHLYQQQLISHSSEDINGWVCPLSKPKLKACLRQKIDKARREEICSSSYCCQGKEVHRKYRKVTGKCPRTWLWYFIPWFVVFHMFLCIILCWLSLLHNIKCSQLVVWSFKEIQQNFQKYLVYLSACLHECMYRNRFNIIFQFLRIIWENLIYKRNNG